MLNQPIVSASKHSIVGAEALIRWNNKLGNVSPAEFISLAESTGIIISIGEWILQTVFTEAHEFYNLYGDDFFISINISGRQLADKDFIGLVEQIYSSKKENKVLPQIHLEITESYLISGNSDVKDILNKLSNMGFSISLDDFGTGYSSLSYIHGYPIDTLKIDRSFIANFSNDKKQQNLIRAIVDMSKRLDLDVIAEGVETESQLCFLVEQGCDLIQGYYFGKPTSKQKFLSKDFMNNISR